jgi:tetratricopeptide (TPR) repeat protein
LVSRPSGTPRLAGLQIAWQNTAMLSRSRRALVWCVCLMMAPTDLAFGQDNARAKDTYARAIELEGQGNHPAALSLLWEAAGLAPRDPDIQNRLGEALERIGALDPAVAAYRVAVQEKPDFRKASNNLILALVKVGKGEEAVQRARAMVSADPKDPDRLFTLGLAQSEQNIDGAIASFRQTLELAPRHVLARYNLALVLNRSDHTAEAVDELKRALAIEPRPEMHYTLGVIYWHQGDLDRGEAELKAAISQQPDYADAYYTLGSVLKSRRDWNQAAGALRRAIAIRPNPSTHYTLAQVLQQSGDEVGARAEFAESERLRQRAEADQRASVWTTVGTQKLDAGDFTAALDLFRRATTASDRYAPAFYQMGRALQGLGRDREAREAFSRAATLNPGLVPPSIHK